MYWLWSSCHLAEVFNARLLFFVFFFCFFFPFRGDLSSDSFHSVARHLRYQSESVSCKQKHCHIIFSGVFTAFLPQDCSSRKKKIEKINACKSWNVFFFFLLRRVKKKVPQWGGFSFILRLNFSRICRYRMRWDSFMINRQVMWFSPQGGLHFRKSSENALFGILCCVQVRRRWRRET